MLSRALEAAVMGHNYDWERAEQGRYMHLDPGQDIETYHEAVSLLLDRGADPDYGSGKLLDMAVQWQQHTLVQLLLDAGASITESALYGAALRGDAAIASRLLAAAKGPVDQHGAALEAAAQLGHITVVEMLLASGANVAAALQLASAYKHVTAATIICEQLESGSHTLSGSLTW
jgi:ankyrin repeat protein